jgi:hypothetical protein
LVVKKRFKDAFTSAVWNSVSAVLRAQHHPVAGGKSVVCRIVFLRGYVRRGQDE